jgi:TonB family protein
MNCNLFRLFFIFLFLSFNNYSFAQDRKIQTLNQHFYPISEKDSTNLAYYSVLKLINENERVEKFYTKEMRLVKAIKIGFNEEGAFRQKVIEKYDELGKISSLTTINQDNNKYYAVYYKNEVLVGDVIFDGVGTFESKRADTNQPVFLDRNEFEPVPFTDKQLWQENLLKNLRYPVQARRLGQSGTVFLALLVDKDSNLVRIEIANPMDVAKSLADEAIRVASLYKGKFIAATDLEGNPVEAWLRIPVRFKLGS